MHLSLIALHNGRTFAILPELLRVLLLARCKYRFHFRNSVYFMIADTNRLWQSSPLSNHIYCLGSRAYPLTKRIARKDLNFFTVTENIWLPFKRV